MNNLSMADLIQTINQQERQKKDHLAESNALSVTTRDNATYLNIPGRFGESYLLNETARSQLATRLEIPYRYAEKLRLEEPRLLDQNLNTLFRRSGEKRLIRTLGSQCRAVLSPNYRILDNYAFLGTVLPLLAQLPDAKLNEAFLTETHLHVSLVFQSAQGYVKPGDPVRYGVMLANSEVGMGSLAAWSFIHRLVCSNGLVVTETDGPTVRRIHLGKRIEDIAKLPSDREVWLEYGDVVRTAADSRRLPTILHRLQIAAQSPVMEAPPEAVEKIVKRFQLTKEEGERVLRQYVAGQDLSTWGLVNALTEAAKEAETIQRRVELQTFGGRMLPEPRMPMLPMAA